MTVLDYFVIMVVGASVALGATRGIIKGLISVLSAAAGLILAGQAYSVPAGVFVAFGAGERAVNLLGFVTVFLLTIAAGGLLARWLRGRVRRARLGWVDHGLGAGFGLVRGWLVCSAVYLALTAFPVKLEAVERATFAPALLEGTRAISQVTSSDLRERFLDGYRAVRELWKLRN